MNQQNQNGVQQNQANAYRQTNAGTTGYGYTPNQYVQRQGQPSVPYQQQTAVQYPAQQSAQKSSGGKIAIAIVAVVLVVGLLGIGAIAMLSGGYYSVGGSNTAKNGENAVSFNEVETPKTDTTVGPSGELLTPAQVAAKVRPSIVSVITVDNVNYMNSDSGEGSLRQAITSASTFLGGKYLTGCTIYVTVEPCLMCAGALGWSQIDRVVYGATDDKRGYHTFCSNPFHKKTEVVGGVLAQECAQLMTDFFKKKR